VGSAYSTVDSTSGFVREYTSKSVPNFRSVLEQGIGLELRGISDSFYLEFGGFVSCSYDVFHLPSSNSVHLLFGANKCRVHNCLWQK